MGCDIHLYIERRTDNVWRTIAPPAPPSEEERTEDRVNHKGEAYRYVSPFWGPGFYVSSCYGVNDDNEDGDHTGCVRCMGTGRDLRWWHDRNYDVFAMLTGTVRNEGNIRGIVAEPRGIPADVTAAVLASGPGDHSRSWLMLDEVLAFDWDSTYVERGVIPLIMNGAFGGLDRDCYQEWRDRKPRKAPRSWSGSVGGGGTYTVTMAVADRILAAHADGRRIDRAETAVDLDAARYRFREHPPRYVNDPDPTRCYVEAAWQQTCRDSASQFLEFVNGYLVPLGDPKDTRLVFGFDS